MYPITADPQFAIRVAQQQIDERVRDAAARRTAREVRRAAGPEPTEGFSRRGRRFAFPRRAFA